MLVSDAEDYPRFYQRTPGGWVWVKHYVVLTAGARPYYLDMSDNNAVRSSQFETEVELQQHAVLDPNPPQRLRDYATRTNTHDEVTNAPD